MDNSQRIRNEFTAFIKTVIENTAINYKRKLLKTLEKEISIENFEILPIELLSCDDSSFLLEHGVKYTNIEDLFTDEKYYKAMKKLSDREKQVLFLSIVEEQRTEQIAKMLNTAKENIWNIKSRAIRNFLNNLENEK